MSPWAGGKPFTLLPPESASALPAGRCGDTGFADVGLAAGFGAVSDGPDPDSGFAAPLERAVSVPDVSVCGGDVFGAAGRLTGGAGFTFDEEVEGEGEETGDFVPSAGFGRGFGARSAFPDSAFGGVAPTGFLDAMPEALSAVPSTGGRRTGLAAVP